MPTNAKEALASLAAEVIAALPGVIPAHVPPGYRGIGDPVYDFAPEFDDHANSVPREVLTAAAQSLEDDPALRELLPRQGENDPFFLYEWGGGRVSLRGMPHSILTSALRRIYYESSEPTAARLTSLVHENYEALRRTLLGEKVLTFRVHGLTGFTMPEGLQIRTPWGVIYPAPSLSPEIRQTLGRSHSASTTAILMAPSETQYIVSRDDEASWSGPRSFTEESRMYLLLPLAFALATDATSRCAPGVTFTTDLEPFMSGGGVGSRPWIIPPVVTLNRDSGPVIEEWAQKLHERHTDNFDVAARRMVTAIRDRFDRSDALIDAVTVWESLVGTSVETSFRVTAALSKLLEPNPAERLAFQKTLRNIYNIRSKVVHGDAVTEAVLQSNSDDAIDIALQALRAMYDRPGEWLSLKSEERANRLILAE